MGRRCTRGISCGCWLLTGAVMRSTNRDEPRKICPVRWSQTLGRSIPRLTKPIYAATAAQRQIGPIASPFASNRGPRPPYRTWENPKPVDTEGTENTEHTEKTQGELGLHCAPVRPLPHLTIQALLLNALRSGSKKNGPPHALPLCALCSQCPLCLQTFGVSALAQPRHPPHQPSLRMRSAKSRNAAKPSPLRGGGVLVGAGSTASGSAGGAATTLVAGSGSLSRRATHSHGPAGSR